MKVDAFVVSVTVALEYCLVGLIGFCADLYRIVSRSTRQRDTLIVKMNLIISTTLSHDTLQLYSAHIPFHLDSAAGTPKKTIRYTS